MVQEEALGGVKVRSCARCLETRSDSKLCGFFGRLRLADDFDDGKQAGRRRRRVRYSSTDDQELELEHGRWSEIGLERERDLSHARSAWLGCPLNWFPTCVLSRDPSAYIFA